MTLLDPGRTALLCIDLQRANLDPSVVTLGIPAERVGPLVQRIAALQRGFRRLGLPVVHVTTMYRDLGEIRANPFRCALDGDGTKARRNVMKHKLEGGAGVEILPELWDPSDIRTGFKKAYSAFLDTDAEFILRHRLGAQTLAIAGVNTTTCVLSGTFEACNRNFAAVVASDCVDTVDGPQMHEFALNVVRNALGWVMPSAAILEALQRRAA